MLASRVRRILVAVLGLILVGSFSGCSSPVNPTTSNDQDLSDGRKEAAKVIVPMSDVYVDLVQQDLNDPNQSRAYPLGNAATGKTPWPSKFGGGKLVRLNMMDFEFDLVASAGETDYIFGVTVPAGIGGDIPSESYTVVSMALSAVNPHTFGHVAGDSYGIMDALLPSNDDTVANRSLIDLKNGGDVALVVRGIPFASISNLSQRYTGKTFAFMSGMGSTADLLYMRDNAIPSGKFFALPGAVCGGPAMMNMTPDGFYFFNSVQVDGPHMTNLLEPAILTSAADLRVATPDPSPGKPYAFLDLSNRDPNGAVANGYGGFMLVVRKEAFRDTAGNVTKVVADPALGAGSTPDPNNLVDAPGSGYNELGLTFMGMMIPMNSDPNNAWSSDNRPDPNDPNTSIPGVQVIGVSVLFKH